jgi:hypothetical protein
MTAYRSEWRSRPSRNTRAVPSFRPQALAAPTPSHAGAPTTPPPAASPPPQATAPASTTSTAPASPAGSLGPPPGAPALSAIRPAQRPAVPRIRRLRRRRHAHRAASVRTTEPARRQRPRPVHRRQTAHGSPPQIRCHGHQPKIGRRVRQRLRFSRPRPRTLRPAHRAGGETHVRSGPRPQRIMFRITTDTRER